MPFLLAVLRWLLLIIVVSTGRSISVASCGRLAWSVPQSSPFSVQRRRQRQPTSSSIIMQQSLDNKRSGSNTLPTKRIVLIGGGHAHVQVIKSLNVQSRPANLHVTLIDLQSSASYSGMVPGCVARLYTLDQVQITLDSLAKWAGIEFICGRVVGMSFEENDGKKAVIVEESQRKGDGRDTDVVKREIPFDVVSVDIGSTTRDFTSIPGAGEYAISTRPISDLVRRIEKEEEILKEHINAGAISNEGAKVVVVGAGAAGIELSLALRARWNDMLESKLSITLIDSNLVLFPSENASCRSALKTVIEKYKVEVRHGLVVDEVTSSHIHVSASEAGDSIFTGRVKKTIPYTHCIWATGAEAHELSWNLAKQCGLSVSEYRGWIRVNNHLQSVSHPSVFAAGDCCEIVSEKGRSPPKAGVYAVRSGPILIENLTRFVGASQQSTDSSDKGDSNLITYQPQDDFLKLLMCGDGTALGFRFGIPLYGKWVWELKNYIDTMFMDLFNVDKLPPCTSESTTTKGEEADMEFQECEYNEQFDTAQYDAYKAKDTKMEAEDAGNLLLRTDDDVDYQKAWSVLREMVADEQYKQEVLSSIRPTATDV